MAYSHGYHTVLISKKRAYFEEQILGNDILPISKNCLYLAGRRIVGVSRLIGWRLRVHHNAASDVTVHTNVTMQCHESARLIVGKVLYSCDCCNAIRIPKMSKRKHVFRDEYVKEFKSVRRSRKGDGYTH